MADEQITSNTANIPYINLIDQSSDQAAPTSGRAILYVKGGVAYVRLPAGDPAPIGGAVALAEGRLAVGDGDGILSPLALGAAGQVVTADASGFATWDDLPAAPAQVGASPISIPPWAFDSYTGNAPGLAGSASTYGGGWLTVTTTAQNDSLTYKLALVAGTYSLRIVGVKGNTCGIITATLGGVSAGTFDQYSSSFVYNQTWEQTGIVVAASGLADLVLTMATKNGSSSNYKYYLTSIALWRTA